MNGTKAQGAPYVSAAAVYLLLLLIALALALGISASYRESQAMASAYARQAEFKQLGADLARGSDYLTDEVRKYAQFGDRTHYDNFWREVHTTRTRDRVVERLRELEAPEDELGLLEQAKQNSDTLIATENRAMALTAKGDFESARRLLFGPEYDTAKRRIMGPIGEFQQRLRSRTARDVAAARAAAFRAFSVLAATSTACVLAMIAGFTLYLRAATRRRQWLRETANALFSFSGQLVANVQSQEHATSVQAVAVAETTATMDELNVSLQQAGTIAQNALDEARRALSLADGRDPGPDSQNRDTASLKQKIRVVTGDLLRLGEHTSQIEVITRAVNELASQTNLLALNASVEAARAGEQGRGFAVVASEIRKLADGSRRSAERSLELLESIRGATTATVLSLEQSSKSVDEVAHSLTALHQAAEQAALNIQQQVAAVGQVSAAMGSLAASAQETAAGIAQARGGIRSLQERAEALNRMV